MYAIFNEGNSGEQRLRGHSTVEYRSDADDQEVIETTEEELSDVFANAGVDELAGAGEPIEVAIEDPLKYRDYLVLDAEVVVFDEEHSREEE